MGMAMGEGGSDRSVDSNFYFKRKNKLLNRAVRKRKMLSSSPEANLRIYALLGATIKKTPNCYKIRKSLSEHVLLGVEQRCSSKNNDFGNEMPVEPDVSLFLNSDKKKNEDCDPFGVGAFLLTVQEHEG
jgi:hypothetical protein